MRTAFLIFLGSGLGGVARYAIGVAFAGSAAQHAFPFATLLVNVLGCLFMGVLLAVLPVQIPKLLAAHPDWHEPLRLALLVGVLGGFTTMSSFGKETLELVQAQHVARAVVYVIASVVLCLVATWAGHKLAHAAWPSRTIS
jgi:CrcB protein